MRKLSALAGIVLIMSPLPALAYTQADADACTPDAFRLCQAAIPDESRVAQCLAQNKRNLSAACKAVFSRPRTAEDSARANRHRKKITTICTYVSRKQKSGLARVKKIIGEAGAFWARSRAAAFRPSKMGKSGG